jgi:hypothetical protein
MSAYCRWADKSLSVIVFENGRGGVNSDHTPMDAMVNVVMSHFIDLGVVDCAGVWRQDSPIMSSSLAIKELTWRLNSKVIEKISAAKTASLKLGKH